MRHPRLMASAGLLVGVVLIGCGDANRNKPDPMKSTDPNQVVCKVAGMH